MRNLLLACAVYLFLFGSSIALGALLAVLLPGYISLPVAGAGLIVFLLAAFEFDARR